MFIYYVDFTTTATDSSPINQSIPNQMAGHKHIETIPIQNTRSSSSVFRQSLLPAIFALFLLFMIVVIVLESDFDIMATIRKAPEIASFKKNYYEPSKNFLIQRFIGSKVFSSKS